MHELKPCRRYITYTLARQLFEALRCCWLDMASHSDNNEPIVSHLPRPLSSRKCCVYTGTGSGTGTETETARWRTGMQCSNALCLCNHPCDQLVHTLTPCNDRETSIDTRRGVLLGLYALQHCTTGCVNRTGYFVRASAALLSNHKSMHALPNAGRACSLSPPPGLASKSEPRKARHASGCSHHSTEHSH